jgi:hypothetical protein
MTHRMRGCAAGILAAALGWTATAGAQQQPPAPPPPKKDPPPIQYDAPKRGAPKGRIGGGTRGDEARELSMAVIAPDHPGLSSRASPRLHWFLSRAINTTFEVSVIEDGAADALLDKPIPAPARAGIQALDLAALGVALKPGRPYRWFISLVSDPKARSGDIVASGKVIYEDLPAAVRARIDAAPPAARPAAFAASGYWYDAYSELRALREKSPEDAALRDMELALVSQVGLDDVVRNLAQIR